MNKLFDMRNDSAVKTGNNIRLMFHSTSHVQSKLAGTSQKMKSKEEVTWSQWQNLLARMN